MMPVDLQRKYQNEMYRCVTIICNRQSSYSQVSYEERVAIASGWDPSQVPEVFKNAVLSEDNPSLDSWFVHLTK